ncbi:MAG: DMT family transporter [Ruminococcaceae bacterium]|nr:DMT family transporter [Oscillospiraceae bacterium]
MNKLTWREISAMLGSCCCSLMFGNSYMFTKRIVGEVTVFALLSWRFLIGAVFMTLLVMVGVMRIDFRSKSPWPLLRMVIFMPAAYYILETYGISLTSASESGTIIALIPIASVIASAVILREKASWVQVTGVLISTTGILIIVLLKGTTPTFSALGYVLLMGAVVCDIGYVITGRQMTQYTVVEKTYFTCLTGAVLFTVCAAVESLRSGSFIDYVKLPFTDGSFLLSAVYLGLGCTTLAFLLLNRSVTILGPVPASAFAGLSTVISVISGVVFLHEPFSTLQGVATGLVLVGIYCVNILHVLWLRHRGGVGLQAENNG